MSTAACSSGMGRDEARPSAYSSRPRRPIVRTTWADLEEQGGEDRSHHDRRQQSLRGDDAGGVGTGGHDDGGDECRGDDRAEAEPPVRGPGGQRDDRPQRYQAWAKGRTRRWSPWRCPARRWGGCAAQRGEEPADDERRGDQLGEEGRTMSRDRLGVVAGRGRYRCARRRRTTAWAWTSRADDVAGGQRARPTEPSPVPTQIPTITTIAMTPISDADRASARRTPCTPTTTGGSVSNAAKAESHPSSGQCDAGSPAR